MSRKDKKIYTNKAGRWRKNNVRLSEKIMKDERRYLYGKSYSKVMRQLSRKVASEAVLLQKETTYEKGLDAWLQSKRINVKESSYVHYMRLVAHQIKPSLGIYPVSEISTQIAEKISKTACGWEIGS